MMSVSRPIFPLPPLPPPLPPSPYPLPSLLHPTPTLPPSTLISPSWYRSSPTASPSHLHPKDSTHLAPLECPPSPVVLSAAPSPSPYSKLFEEGEGEEEEGVGRRKRREATPDKKSTQCDLQIRKEAAEQRLRRNSHQPTTSFSSSLINRLNVPAITTVHAAGGKEPLLYKSPSSPHSPRLPRSPRSSIPSSPTPISPTPFSPTPGSTPTPISPCPSSPCPPRRLAQSLPRGMLTKSVSVADDEDQRLRRSGCQVDRKRPSHGRVS